ncbi:F0F1-type ATP synthase assembly protein I [Kitasatospora sp. MAA19]|uniref:hypothetical protein n=1 Tax=unclassified Kitasatospora TaxID=2633591 RepID=UPI0024747034|nr:hypothetical protein [Kitasatospora sp. MAA19]MDH6709196.1 F0F1-type ATP synthase assembly protein I [Kitasatospora sp. MAA19]
MSTHRTPGPAAVGIVCFLLGVQVRAATLYLLQHRAQLTQPLYLAVFALVGFATLVVTDRLLASRSTPKRRTGPSQEEPSRPAN